MQQYNRPLTYDEKKAAEAAFQRLPRNPKWSQAAQKVYAGISLAMGAKQQEVFQDDHLSLTTTIAERAEPESQQLPRIIG
ncbi:MAG: hypothetical protein NPIRA04_26430 [Nitrospirales bacterium]|nr:MAG: hypothetical protein NPIRA04_26430 [Nitrospirales bacterium]